MRLRALPQFGLLLLATGLLQLTLPLKTLQLAVITSFAGLLTFWTQIVS
jgi:hypothetical protein